MIVYDRPRTLHVIVTTSGPCVACVARKSCFRYARDTRPDTGILARRHLRGHAISSTCFWEKKFDPKSCLRRLNVTTNKPNEPIHRSTNITTINPTKRDRVEFTARTFRQTIVKNQQQVNRRQHSEFVSTRRGSGVLRSRSNKVLRCRGADFRLRGRQQKKQKTDRVRGGQSYVPHPVR